MMYHSLEERILWYFLWFMGIAFGAGLLLILLFAPM